jgi:hypothetical protein
VFCVFFLEGGARGFIVAHESLALELLMQVWLYGLADGEYDPAEWLSSATC